MTTALHGFLVVTPILAFALLPFALRAGGDLSIDNARQVWLLSAIGAIWGLLIIGILGNAVGPSLYRVRDELNFGFCLMSLSFVFYLFSTRKQTHLKHAHELRLDVSVLGTFLIITLPFIFYMHAMVPIFGWDTLEHWGRASIDYILQSQELEYDWSWRRPPSPHPATVSVLSAWFNQAGHDSFTASLRGLPWTVGYLSMAVCSFLHARLVGASLFESIVCLLVIATLPLLVNHLLIIGYAELFVSAVMLTCVIICTHIKILCLAAKSGAIILGVVTLTALKNTGFFFALILILSIWMASLGGRRFSTVVTIMTVSLLLCVLALLLFFETGSGLTMTVAGRQLTLQPDNLTSIPLNLYHSLLVNTSFGVAPLILAVAIVFCMRRDLRSAFGFRLILLSAVGSLLFVSVAQLTDYGFEHAVPGGDSGSTRFTLPSMVLTCLLLPYLLLLSRRQREDTNSI